MSMFSMLAFDENCLGVVIRDTPANDAPLEMPIVSAESAGTVKITPDNNEEYTLHGDWMASMPLGSLYDDGIKILEWSFSDEGCLSLTSFTHKQVNLFANFKLKECLITANGPLFMAGENACESSLVIEAEAFYLKGSLTSEGTVSIVSRIGVGIFAPLRAQNLSINAVYVLQGAELLVSGELAISTDFFKQEAAAKTQLDALRIIARQCQISGDLEVHQTCFLTADAMRLGHGQSETTLELNGETHLHAGNLHIEGNTQVRIGSADYGKENHFSVDSQLVLDSSAMVDFYNTTLAISEIDNQGDVSFHQSTAVIRILRQSGVFDACRSRVTVLEYLAHDDCSLTELRDTSFSSKNVYVCGGKFSINDGHYQGDSCHVFAGFLTVANTSLVELNHLLLAEEGHAGIQGGKVSASQSIVAAGELLLDRTEVLTKHLKTTAGKTVINQSTVIAAIQIALNGVTELTHSRLSSGMLMLSGEVTINCAQLHAKFLEMVLEPSVISALSSFSEKLHVQGSQTPEQVVLKGCVLTSSRFSFAGHATIEQSAVFGVSSEPLSHTLHAHLSLIRSRFITNNQLDNGAGSKLVMGSYSRLSVGMLHSQGRITAKNSTVFCDATWQEQAAFRLKSSFIEVRGSVILQESRMDVKKNSKARARNVQLQQGSILKLKEKSHLAAHSLFSTASESTLKSKASEIVANKCMASGHTGLSSSTLSAVTFIIGNAFRASQQSKITVEKRMLVAHKAMAHFSDSLLTSADIETFGEWLTHHSRVLATKTFSVWSPAAMILKEGTLLLARNMLIRGQMRALNEKNSKELEEAEPSLISVVNINGELLVTQQALVHGSADMFIDANRYVHLGTLKLGAHLCVKGGMLYNLGTIESEEMNLGFDDGVVNLGRLSAKILEIHSNFFNLTGRVHAAHSLRVAGFYGVNLGLMVADNYTNTLLFSVQSGLVLSCALASLESFLSWEGYFLASLALISRIWPQYTGVISLMHLIPELLHHAHIIYDFYKHFDSTRCKTLRRHEWMSIISQLTETFWLFHQVFHTALPSHGGHHDSVTERQSPSEWRLLAAGLFDAFSNESIRASLVDIHAGISLAPSMLKEALYTVNTGFEVALTDCLAENKLFDNHYLSAGESTVSMPEKEPASPHSGQAFFREARPAVINEAGCRFGDSCLTLR